MGHSTSVAGFLSEDWTHRERLIGLNSKDLFKVNPYPADFFPWPLRDPSLSPKNNICTRFFLMQNQLKFFKVYSHGYILECLPSTPSD